MKQVELDKLDQRILAILQRDGRISNQQLAEQVGLSPAACWRRVRALEESGVIKGYSAHLTPERIGHGLCVLVNLSLQRHTIDSTAEIERQVSSYPEVLQCFAVTGNADFVLRIIVPDMASYDRFLNEKIFTLQGIAQVNSNFVLREIKNTQMIPVGSGD
ncbi:MULTISPECIES: Lrp/AsnC family transcriptional regulator [unclassified Marinobacter]|uniref:Lrp/AsnC family transcriptional regulator n=1 Tax=unclassified Marinobacter TaxID=83889 RepID=UPI00190310AF|nr:MULTISPECIES: Lrp/AsnC family transcriptional regulator [unclassified Marinobacter]MBK1850078.1 Lrp/AsnC family transcriptional regulator [Marinobacter sp. 1-4A]MCK0163927.1 Lrp/AsnC family transcriptional regulator [Marinobacter sp. S6332]